MSYSVMVGYRCRLQVRVCLEWNGACHFLCYQYCEIFLGGKEIVAQPGWVALISFSHFIYPGGGKNFLALGGLQYLLYAV
jgi:hypothetical protein